MSFLIISCGGLKAIHILKSFLLLPSRYITYQDEVKECAFAAIYYIYVIVGCSSFILLYC